MSAQGRESRNHEVPLPHRLSELKSGMEADDPDAVARGPLPGGERIQAPMRGAEIHKKRDFG